MNKKVIATVGACALCLGLGVAGTLAWLTDRTDPVVNTFTDSDINISLTETEEDFQMVPGFTIDKDPKVTVKAGSEKCYLFVKIETSTNYGQYLEPYIVDTSEGNWSVLTDVPGVYYRVVDELTTDQDFNVLQGNHVKVLNTVTKQMMDAIDGVVSGELGVEEQKAASDAELALRPTLTVTAYATQYYKSNTGPAENPYVSFTPMEAWNNVSNPSGTVTE